MTPIALFTYNRSVNLAKTLACLKNNEIDLLYIFSDGPKDKVDEEKVSEVRKILDQITWVKTEKFYQEKNLGLSASIIFGVNKVMEKYDKIICVEDDICVADNFYKYMEACLEKYKDNSKIAGITGLRYPFSSKVFKNYPFDVFFTPRFSSWGWGTWRRFWQTVDFDRASVAKKIELEKLDTRPAGSDMKNMVNDLVAGTLHGCWDVFCGINMLLHKQLFISPVWNMVENNGFFEGTHKSPKLKSWQLQWENKKSPQIINLKLPETEKEQEKIRKSFLAFLKSNQPSLFERVLAKIINLKK